MIEENQAKLPSYDEVAGPSRLSQDVSEPGHKQSPPSKKRRLESPSAPCGVDADESVALVARSEQFRDQMRVFVREVTREDLSRGREEVWNEVLSELGKMETRIMSSVTDQVDELRDEFLERIDEATAQAVSRGDLEELVDDQTAGMKIELEEFVRDEMRNEMCAVEDTTLDHLETGTWYGPFRRRDDTSACPSSWLRTTQLVYVSDDRAHTWNLKNVLSAHGLIESGVKGYLC